MKVLFEVRGLQGHRQRESFNNSTQDCFKGYTMEIFNHDTTHTNDYSLMLIDAPSTAEAEQEASGQITDGVFENSRTGQVNRYKLHHTALRIGYVSVKAIGIPRAYKGRYGTGYTIDRHNPNSTRFLIREYYI